MSSKTPRPVNLRDELHFPTYRRLPFDQTYDAYYTLSGIVGSTPAMHWCLLVEVVEEVPWIVRRMFRVKDLEGSEFLLTFNLNNTDTATTLELTKKVNAGCTISISHAKQHHFMDGQVGIRIEVASSFKVFQCDLASFMKIGDDLEKPSNLCPVCSKPAALRCSRCTLKYCSKECQVAGWKSEHKKMCGAGQQIMKWGNFNWKDFDSKRAL